MGTPSQEEMRAALAQAGGDMRTAENAVFEERQRKVSMCVPVSVMSRLISIGGMQRVRHVH